MNWLEVAEHMPEATTFHDGIKAGYLVRDELDRQGKVNLSFLNRQPTQEFGVGFRTALVSVYQGITFHYLTRPSIDILGGRRNASITFSRQNLDREAPNDLTSAGGAEPV